MQYHVLACDYDATLASEGKVDAAVVAALARLAASGRRLVLATGRRFDDLCSVFPDVALFDLVVAENGGVLYDPRRPVHWPLAAPPPAKFLARLRARGVDPLAVGEVIVATRDPHDRAVDDSIRELGLALQVIHNKGAVMVLPRGVDKASGVAAALRRLGHSPRAAVAVGDAENDCTMLRMCGHGVAVANALEAVKQASDRVTAHPNGRGVVELVDWLLTADPADRSP
ncbi:HAD family hydrolase [Thermobifida fusca]|uniref:HAD family hydrolase n=1 Tax=Thermobifida fusca TaxID=2021 RepID=UPI0018787F2F|nr:HAD family hydrolase [Thermobifida fusca]QOS58294.1 HAD family phosphatase [Thermobifida fusca]